MADQRTPKLEKEDPVWSILPSYYMYQSTFYGELDPPQYVEASSCDGESRSQSQSNWSSEAPTAATTLSSGSVAEPAYPASPNSSDTSLGSLIIADESTNCWRETILDNIHELPNMTESSNSCSQSLDILVHFTTEVGEPGKKPTHLDPLNFEYKQGDFLNGYVLIKNNGTESIPFDMFYVLFEGNFIVANVKDSTDKTPIKIRKFLEMYDFAASWNDAPVNRLLSEHKFGMECCCSGDDPVDGTRLSIDLNKKIEPGCVYKRFFTFKIPLRLLDSECHDHNLAGHTELPPTLGLSRKEKEFWTHSHKPVDDFSFIDTATNYGVLARFIGKARKYNFEPQQLKGTKLINEEGDQFVILKEQIAHVRILQESLILSEGEKAVNSEASRVLYQNFVNRVKEKVEVGKELKRAIENMDDKASVDISMRIAAEAAVQARTQDNGVKARQLYTRFDRSRDHKFPDSVKREYNIVAPLMKKSIFGPSKPLGTLSVLTPKTEYMLNYISPHRFRYGETVDDAAWKLQVPLEITFTPSSAISKKNQVPEIRHISAEFVVFTLKSNNRQIPVELNHDFLFKNEVKTNSALVLNDNFTTLVKKPLKRYANELFALASELGVDNFKIEKSLVEDLSAMTNLEEKYNVLVLHDLELSDDNGRQSLSKKEVDAPWKGNADGPVSKKFSVCVDLAKAQKKAPNMQALAPDYKSYNEFTLVPSFQTCLISRMYYLRILLFLTNDQVVDVKVPVTIGKMPTN